MDTCVTAILCTFPNLCPPQYYVPWYINLSFSGLQIFSLPAGSLFSRSRLRSMQEDRLYTTVQVWVPTGLRDACSGRSKSRNLAINHGTAFRPVRANQAHANLKTLPVFFFFFCLSPVLLLKYHSSRQTPLIGSHGTTAALQTFPVVAATSSASACGFVSIRVCARVSL